MKSVAACMIVLGAVAAAQEKAPELRGPWANTTGLRADRLRGKVVVLYFFHKDCPVCKAAVPDYNEMRRRYRDKPAVFIAVNSGSSKADMDAYARATHFEWPILIDASREIEKKMLPREIEARGNTFQWIVVDPEGKFQSIGADGKQAELFAQRLLASAKSIFDGIEIPERLKEAARDIDMGEGDRAVAKIAVAAKSGPEEDRAAAQAMFDRIKASVEENLDKAKTAQAAGRTWEAYKAFDRIAGDFKGTDYEKTATDALSELKNDKAVKDEFAAQKPLEKARKLLSTGREGDKSGARQILQALRKKYPDTEAAKDAADLLK